MITEQRRSNEVVFQPKGERPLKKTLGRYPQVSYRDKTELTREVEKAARHYWPNARSIHAEVRHPWRACTGEVVVTMRYGTVVATFAPVWDPSRPTEAQARPQQDSGQVAPQW
ncbi:hypothetical protein AB0K08_13710 [Citricoccus sp. NPDC055426]|uniref:hypothetical protein n=1 Tax=Citricoccus sp. NPDC055426 TaxID=3155536 RepID=UPI003416BA86